MLLGVVEDEEALHLRALHDQVGVVARALRRRTVVLRDRAADHDAGVQRQVGQRHLQQRSADVVEVHVDPVGADHRPQRLGDVVGLVVHALVEAELVDDVGALLGPARRADDPAALQLGDLPDDRAGRAGRTADQDRVALLQLTDAQQAEVGGQAGGAEQRDGDQRVGALGEDLHRAGATLLGDDVLLPAGQAADERTHGVLVGRGLDDLADAHRADDLADADGRQVGVLLHPAADGRVEREVGDLHQRLAVTELGHGLAGELDVLVRGEGGGGALGQAPHPVGLGGAHDRRA